MTTQRTIEQYQRHEEQTRETLRSVCAEFGDNNWPDDLHFSDVIEKHLIRHIIPRIERRESK